MTKKQASGSFPPPTIDAAGRVIELAPPKKQRVWPWILGALAIAGVVGSVVQDDDDRRAPSSPSPSLSYNSEACRGYRDAITLYGEREAVEIVRALPEVAAADLGDQAAVIRILDRDCR